MKKRIVGFTLLTMSLGALASEAEHKVAFVAKSLPFVEWPGTVTSIDFCTVVPNGHWPHFLSLNQQSVKGKNVVVERIERGNDLTACDVLYLGEMTAIELEYWGQQISGLPIYSICESWHCARENVMLGLGMENGRLYFEFNARVMKRAELRLDSRFLRLARTLY